MTARVWFLTLVTMVVACAPATTTVDPEVDATVTMRVYQEQTSCCYIEGQVSFLSVGGTEYEIRLSRIGLVPLLELEIPIAETEVESWQRPCEGNCGQLDPPANQCSITIDPEAAETIRLLVTFEPGPDPCQLTTLDDDPETTVPLAYGFRTPLPSCGEDFTMQQAMFGDVDFESPERRCFVGAHQTGEPAELSAYEPPDPNAETDDILDLVIYRTQPDRPVEVFVNVGPDFESWLYYQCDVLSEADGPALFALEECTEPELLQ